MSGRQTRAHLRQQTEESEDNDDVPGPAIAPNPRAQEFDEDQEGEAQGHEGNEGSDNDDEEPAAIPKDDTSQVIKAALTSILSDVVTSSKGTDVRAPDKFTGLDRSKFKTYIAQCRLVFRANPKRFDTDTKQVTYACSYLDGLAFQWYQNFLDLDKDPAWFDNWKLFREELSKQFGEVNAEAVAERNIRGLQMRTSDSIVSYLTQFHSYANLLAWNDEALVSEFRRGLAGRIKDELAHLDRDQWTLHDLEARCIRIDHRYWERQKERTFEVSDNRPSKATSSTPTTTTTQRAPSKAFQSARPKTSTTAASILPLDESGRITADERQRRIDNNLCHYCGGPHRLDNCPKKPTSSKTNVRQATVSFNVSGNE